MQVRYQPLTAKSPPPALEDAHAGAVDHLDKKIFGTLFFALFAVITGVGIVVPLLPVYAHDLGASGVYIGLIFGSFSFSRTFLIPYFGRLSDKKGRKPFLISGIFIYALISVGFMLSDRVETLIILRFFQGMASAMIMPVVLAYVGDITPEKQEGTVMGIFNMSMFLGLSLGPLMGGYIKDQFSLNAAFLCMGGLSLISFGLILTCLPPTKQERISSQGAALPSWTSVIRDREIAGLFLFRIVFAACIGIVWGFLPVFADTQFSLTSSAIGLLVPLGVFMSGLTQPGMGFLADRFNKKVMVIVGGIIIGYAMLSFIWARGFTDLVITNILFGIGGGISTAPHSALSVIKGTKVRSMGSVMALMTMGHSLGMLAGSFFAGLIMDLYQLQHAFLFGAISMAAGLIGFAWTMIPNRFHDHFHKTAKRNEEPNH